MNLTTEEGCPVYISGILVFNFGRCLCSMSKHWYLDSSSELQWVHYQMSKEEFISLVFSDDLLIHTNMTEGS